MKKIKSEILETDITKLILLSMALTIAMVALISSASATAPNPNYGSGIEVDGNADDWDLTADYFADMYRAGDPTKDVESKLYLRYNCSEKVMYALVLEEDPAQALEWADDAWIAINEVQNKVVLGDSNNFAWVYDSENLLGYEASFAIDEGTYKILAHIEVFDDGKEQTSATHREKGEPALDLIISCPVTASIGNFVWNDLNRNGIQDEEENGIAGVTIELYECGGTTLIATTTTDSNGLYQFTDLMPGIYQVKFILPSGYAFSSQDQGDNDEKDSDADPTTGQTACIILTAGQEDLKWDAGMYELIEKLEVSKTAITYYTRTHKWGIDKLVTTKQTHEGVPKIWLYTDGHGDETATWTVDVSYEGSEDSDFKVSGVITIENTGDLSATIISISDVLGETGIPVTVSCDEEFPYELGVGKTLVCSYSEDINSKIEGSNVVAVTTERNNEYKGSAEIVWSDTPDTENYKTINVRDSSVLFGEKDLGTLTAPGNKQFTYFKDFAWEDYGKDAGGDYTYPNTATIVETGQSDDATLKVNVQCYMYETAYAKGGDDAICFIPTFKNWGWTNPIVPGTYTMDLWAGAAQCDTSRGILVGTVNVVYGSDGYVTVTYDMDNSYLLEETHVYAGYVPFPTDKKDNPTVAPGMYSNASPFSGGDVYVIAHAKVGIPDPNFGPM